MTTVKLKICPQAVVILIAHFQLMEHYMMILNPANDHTQPSHDMNQFGSFQLKIHKNVNITSILKKIVALIR